jgi:hypothetical protein
LFLVERGLIEPACDEDQFLANLADRLADCGIIDP